MTNIITNCPRCGSNEITFDVFALNPLGRVEGLFKFESFSVCRNCTKSVVFILNQKDRKTNNLMTPDNLLGHNIVLNKIFNVNSFVGLKDINISMPPDFLPTNIEKAFNEGASCNAIACYNAAGAMFRLCIDLTTKKLLPKEDKDGLNSKVRRNLGLRLPWLFKNDVLPKSLKNLSECIKDDGNDGAHDGTLTREDIEDITDFTFLLLERIFTEPERIKNAEKRRLERRQVK